MLSATPSVNKSLRFDRANFSSLVEGLDYAARGETGYNFYSGRGELKSTLSYAELRDNARSLAATLAATGLERQARVAVAAETIPEFSVLFFACQYAGLLPVPLPVHINLGGREAYVHRLRGLMEASSVSAAVSSPELIDLLSEACETLPVKFVGTHDDLVNLPGRDNSRPFAADEPAYIQYSSGSTRRPKGVLISQRAITSNAKSILSDGIELRQGDRCASWLPLYHDMGLVGCCLTPVLSQTSVDYLATSDFAKRPLVWLQLLSETRGTVAFSPSFGYELCQRRASNGAISSLDLSSWRVAGIGGDMIRDDVLDRFAEKFAASGFKRAAFLPSYGLAESTLAVTFTGVENEFETDTIDRKHLSISGQARPLHSVNGAKRARRLVVCGKPMPGHQLEIVDKNGLQLGDRDVGRIVIRGPSLMDGFFNDERLTRDVLSDDGWLDTGDLGYTVNGSLVVTGRSKDLIIINGRNIWPEDIEWAVQELPGIRRGDVAAFAVDRGNEEGIVTVIHCRARDPVQRKKLERQVRSTVRLVAGADCDVVLVSPGSISMTSSGKIGRAATRERYLAGDYQAGSFESASARAAVG